MTWWMWLSASLLLWLAIGAGIGRHEFTSVYRESREKGALDEKAAEQASSEAWILFWLWPLVAALGICIAPFVLPWMALKWFFAGGVRADRRREVRRNERVEQLRNDAAQWTEKATSGTDSEREMAKELARLCREQATDLERAS